MSCYKILQQLINQQVARNWNVTGGWLNIAAVEHWLTFHLRVKIAMNVYQWFGLDNPSYLLSSLMDSPVSERKLHLFAVACCRRIWHLIEEEKDREAVEAAERWADGQTTRRKFRAAAARCSFTRQASHLNPEIINQPDRELPASWHAAWAAYSCASDNSVNYWADVMKSAENAAALIHQGRERTDARFIERDRQADLLRCIFGNPFQAQALDLGWRTPDVIAVTQSIYDERRFSEMPILADALEEAGCTNEKFLSHCRNGKVHVRGCWLVDQILEK